MTTILSFLVVIGPLILIHELGHFLVARWAGVGVERFSFGFGPVLLRWRGAGTEYCLSAIPVGGYVKMVGEESPLEGGGTPAFDPRQAFAAKPLWARFLIVFAGPGMNFVLAAVIASLVLATAGRPVWSAVVGRVSEGGPAERAGLRAGDVVRAVDGRPVAYWEDVDRALEAAAGRPLTLTVERGGTRLTVPVTPRRTTVPDPIFRELRSVWDLGAGPRSVPYVTSIGAGSPAEAAGLRVGDVIVAVAGERVYTADELVRAIRARPRQTVALVVEREGRPLTLQVTPEVLPETGPGGQTVEVGRIQAGIGNKPAAFEPYGPGTALWYGALWTRDTTVITLKGLWKVVTGALDRSNIGGPILIASEAGRQAREGPSALAMFTAFISVNLAVLNLLPVPILDGGHLLFFLIEAVRGRPLSLRKREAAQQLGFLLLLLLMIFALYNDLARLDAFRFLR